jgi:hypothetical protein
MEIVESERLLESRNEDVVPDSHESPHEKEDRHDGEWPAVRGRSGRFPGWRGFLAYGVDGHDLDGTGAAGMCLPFEERSIGEDPTLRSGTALATGILDNFISSLRARASR